nr:MAG TPA: hypothetical protein [Caudoviricetes sp.]DAH57065.1 MAG TPA: hypothetical protein [Caudoviricetes sp.]
MSNLQRQVKNHYLSIFSYLVCNLLYFSHLRVY